MAELHAGGESREDLDTLNDPEGYLPPLESDPRPKWDSYFMDVARLVSIRSTCLARKVGAVIVRDRRIMTTGYNGTAATLPHCIDLGCLRRGLGIPSGERIEFCRGSCAEENAIIQAARFGLSIAGGRMYTTHQPCLKCARMIINVGLVGVTFAGDYPQPMAVEFLQEAGIEMAKFNFETGATGPVDPVPKTFLARHAHRSFKGAGNDSRGG